MSLWSGAPLRTLQQEPVAQAMQAQPDFKQFDRTSAPFEGGRRPPWRQPSNNPIGWERASYFPVGGETEPEQCEEDHAARADHAVRPTGTESSGSSTSTSGNTCSPCSAKVLREGSAAHSLQTTAKPSHRQPPSCAASMLNRREQEPKQRKLWAELENGGEQGL